MNRQVKARLVDYISKQLIKYEAFVPRTARQAELLLEVVSEDLEQFLDLYPDALDPNAVPSEDSGVN